ncbi:MAG TPA: hypothetical protein VGG91_18620, partial [Myxococcaceae bacterium]
MTVPRRSACALLVLLCGSAFGQDRPDGGSASTADLQKEVDELKRRVEILGEELETQKTGSAPVLPASGDLLERGRALGLSPA